MEGDDRPTVAFSLIRYFNPLPPYGGRPITPDYFFRRFYISIHSLRMEGDIALFDFGISEKISIHSLRMEGDLDSEKPSIDTSQFQSTPSVWRETFLSQLSFPAQKNFNPLPPYGGRQITCFAADVMYSFQSTPSVWRETFATNTFYLLFAFQSTPSVWRETSHKPQVQMINIFQSTPSVWRETLTTHGKTER